MRHLVIGASGHAQEVAWSLSEQLGVRGERAELSFFDDAIPRGPLTSGLGEVIGTIDDVAKYVQRDRVELVLGVGLPRTKIALHERLRQLALPWATVVHPRATLGPNVRLGEGTYVAAGAIVTLNVQIGRMVTINMHSQVAHDSTVGDFSTLHPDVHLAGNVCIGASVELGTGSIAIPGVRIGDRAVLGAGSVAIRSLSGDHCYVGIPARNLAHEPHSRTAELRRRSEGEGAPSDSAEPCLRR